MNRKNRLNLSSTLMDIVGEMGEGNPGAINVIMTLLTTDPTNILLLTKCDYYGIYESRLYMLWNDCCGRDFEIMRRALEEFTEEDIIDHIDNNSGYGRKFYK